MRNKPLVVNGILWAAAILAAAIMGAPKLLSTLLLPSLAVCSILFIRADLRDKTEVTSTKQRFLCNRI